MEVTWSMWGHVIPKILNDVYINQRAAAKNVQWYNFSSEEAGTLMELRQHNTFRQAPKFSVRVSFI